MTNRGYIIKENGRAVSHLVNTARYGWTRETKTWKTESAAKAWVTRRIKQIGEKACDYTFEIKEHW